MRLPDGNRWAQGTGSDLPADPHACLFLQVPRLYLAAHLLNLYLLSHVQEAHQYRQGEAGLVGRRAHETQGPRRNPRGRSGVKPVPFPSLFPHVVAEPAPSLGQLPL